MLEFYLGHRHAGASPFRDGCRETRPAIGRGHPYKEKNARRSVSRVLSPRKGDDHSSGTSVTGRLLHPTRTATRKRVGVACRPYSGLLPVGFAVPRPLPARAVRSYRTLSPLPAFSPKGSNGRFAFCGTFPRVAPAGCYPAPCFHGARTFLPPAGFPIAGRRSSDRLAGLR